MIKCKHAFFMLLTFCCCALAMPARAETTAVPFVKGEKIHYSVKQMGIKAGDATLEFKGQVYLDGEKYTFIHFVAKGFNFYDEERIYVDPQSFYPKKIYRELNIFGNHEKILEEYFPADGFIRITKEARGKVTIQNISKTGLVDNIYGFLYRARMKEEVKVGKSIQLRLPLQDVTLNAEREVPFQAMGKEFQSVMYKSVPPKYTIWFDPSPQKLPLRIAGAIGMSNTVMVITGYEAK